MVDWYGARHNETFSFRGVDWETGAEIGDYNQIKSGSVELSALSDTKASCTFEFEGNVRPSTTNYARIYYQFTDMHGERSERIPLGTFMVSYDTTENMGVYAGSKPYMKVKGTANGTSTLKRLSERKLGGTYYVPAGTNAMDRAINVLEACNVFHNNPVNPGWTTKSDHIFEPEDSHLVLVNWLLNNMSPAYQLGVNAYGQAQIEPYIAPTERTVSHLFKDGENAIFQPAVSVSNDWQGTANELYAIFEDETCYIRARAIVASGAKFAYNENGQRLITADILHVDELDGATPNDKKDNLKAIALSAMRDKCNEIEHVEFTHAYIPAVQPNAAIALDYAGEHWSGNVTNMQISLTAGSQTKTKMRRFIANDLDIQVSGWVYWQL